MNIVFIICFAVVLILVIIPNKLQASLVRTNLESAKINHKKKVKFGQPKFQYLFIGLLLSTTIIWSVTFHKLEFDFWEELYAVILGPVLEEIVFRFVPARIAGLGHLTGMYTSLIFGLAHYTGAGSVIRVCRSVMLGVLFWYIQKKAGLVNSMLAHIGVNLAVTLFSIFKAI